MTTIQTNQKIKRGALFEERRVRFRLAVNSGHLVVGVVVISQGHQFVGGLADVFAFAIYSI